MDVYELVRGPFVWIALSIFILGCIYRVIFIFAAGKNDINLYPSDSLKHGFRSIVHGMLPFGSEYMRRQPVFTIITFLFHFCVVVIPVFLLAHIVLWYESWEIIWWGLPDVSADIMAVAVILSCIYFFVRRLVIPEVQKVSRPSDFIFLIMILIPFLSGFLAYHQWGPYRPILILHIVSSEILLITIPFSRLGHMLFFLFSRAHMGSEFGKALKANEW